MIAGAIRRTVEHRGGVSRFKRELLGYAKNGGAPEKVLEYVVEGPRGTGKSNGTAFTFFKLCKLYQGVRILVIRKARSLLTDTFCKTYEEDVCPEHASVTAIQRMQRHEYVFPETDSRIVLGGLDQPGRYYGSDWDIVCLEEAVQFRWKDVEPFLGSLRNNKLGFHALVYVTNPDAPSNYVNRRAEAGLAKRFVCRLRDNPSLYDFEKRDWLPKGRTFNQTLDRYSGVERARHRDGLWQGAEGMVWENYDPEIHLIDAPVDSEAYKQLGLKDYIGSLDWGFTAPGSLSVWGRDGDKRAVRVAQVYRTKQTAEWWAERISDLDDEFALLRVVADPSRNDLINLVNDWLVKMGKPRLVEAADNTKASSLKGDLAGLDLVRWGFERDETGTPRLRFLTNALRFGRDEELFAAGKPIDTPGEVPEYAFARDSHGEIINDRTDDKCADHGCDETRYFCTENWRRRAPIEPAVPAYAPRSLGSILDHASEFKRTRRVRV